MTDFGGSGSRRRFAGRILREAAAQASSGVIDLSASIGAMTVASTIAATDSFPFIDATGVGYRAAASVLRTYVLGISGGTATIPENVVIQGNTTLGDATSDTLTVTARLAADLDPSANNTVDLGASGLAYKDGWFAGVVTSPSFVGALTGNASTATAWQTARTLTVGATGKSVDGTANVTWSLAEIGAGDVFGPASATDNAIAVWDTTSGKLLKNSSLLISGTTIPALTGIGTLASGAVPASLVTAGTFGAGAYTFPSSLAITGAFSGATTGAFSSNVTIGGTLGVTGAVTATAGLTTGGQILVPNGSVGAPSYSFFSDATSGWYRIAAGTYGFSVLNSEQLRVTNATLTHNGTTASLAQSATSATLNVGSGSGSAATTLIVNAAAGQQAIMQWRSAGTRRLAWIRHSDDSQFFLQAYDDIGTPIDVPMSVVRAAGGTIAFSSARPITGGTYNGQTISSAASFTGTMTVQGASSLNGNVTVGGTLGVTGLITSTGGISASGSVAHSISTSSASGITLTASAGVVTLAGDGSGSVTVPTRYANVTTSDNNQLMWNWDAGTSNSLVVRMRANADVIAFGISTIDSGSFVIGPGDTGGVFSGSGGYWSKISAAGGYEVAVASVFTSTVNVTGILTSSTGAVINESGANSDTRIEGDTDINLLFVDASTDRVGVGTATPSDKLEVSGTVNATAYKVGGTAGFTGTGAYTNFTIVNGIITNAS